MKFKVPALLLDSSLVGEFDLIQRIISKLMTQACPMMTARECPTLLCAGHTEVIKFLVQFGVDVNAADSVGGPLCTVLPHVKTSRV